MQRLIWYGSKGSFVFSLLTDLRLHSNANHIINYGEPVHVISHQEHKLMSSQWFKQLFTRLNYLSLGITHLKYISIYYFAMIKIVIIIQTMNVDIL